MKELKITAKQEKNLRTLAEYLLSDNLVAQFDMSKFTEYSMWEEDTHLNCGTVGCAVGHGPYAGIRKKKREDWIDYARRVFGCSEDNNLFVWAFSGSWVTYDNTAKGAAKRILYAIEYGVPEIHDRHFIYRDVISRYIRLYKKL